MAVHLYFSLIPEALIASMLPPEKFGQYYATGHKYKSKGQEIFFEIDPAFRHPFFEIDTAVSRCVPHPDGAPKNSVYVSVYRVLEHIPVSAIGKIYLTTAYGATIGLDRGTLPTEWPRCLHFYQDLAPVNSLVVSNQDPVGYYEGVTSKAPKFIRFPGLCFVELQLGALATDPEGGAVGDLPYSFMHHLREALLTLEPGAKESKLVHRVHSLEFPYRMVKGGFYIGNGRDIAHYPMPTVAELQRDHPSWWRSANM
ncbi:MAG: hypothetical protein HXX10_22545 [Rhodoplanes sp.]|uniref:hypothetical protein n=1 Tax=Rhodoplanes sp. TaxID=1968906 RepID=UPI0017D2A91A|nr:hypothetical protein [Rhodoplanes sp.]NVO16814.1 hypothetical protein [Rhodoplanes sp.]